MRSLSVIVPTYNRAEQLAQCLSALRASTFQDYELIVVDSGSQDDSPRVARRYADRLIILDGVPSQSRTRNAGMAAAHGEIVVNVDSDIVVRPDTLERIAAYFTEHPDIDGVTGLLAAAHPHPGFFSQYKNLYMHHMFRTLPARITFLYGSIHAVRRSAIRMYGEVAAHADDLALGQQLIAEGRRIAFLRELEVSHLKQYTWRSMLLNDMRIPADWARVFVAYRGWRQLGRQQTGFAHASSSQLFAVVLAALMPLAALLARFSPSWMALLAMMALTWLLLIRHLVRFLADQRGPWFGLLAIPVTFIDHLVMAAGIAYGLLIALQVSGFKVMRGWRDSSGGQTAWRGIRAAAHETREQP